MYNVCKERARGCGARHTSVVTGGGCDAQGGVGHTRNSASVFCEFCVFCTGGAGGATAAGGFLLSVAPLAARACTLCCNNGSASRSFGGGGGRGSVLDAEDARSKSGGGW